MIGKVNNMKKGITLVELLISIGLFSIVIVAFLQLFSSAFAEQRKILVKNFLLNNTSYSVEYISRALRMAQKDNGGNCISSGNNYEIILNGQGIKFLNYKGQCQEFFLENKILKVRKFDFPDVAHELISNDLKVNKLIFQSTDGTLNVQPKITFAVEFETQLEEKLKIQTTVTQRNLDL